MIKAAESLAASVGVVKACAVLGVPRSRLYRARQTVVTTADDRATSRPKPDRALSEDEHCQVRDLLNSERFQDAAPRQIYAALLDEGVYLCSWRTMYRILEGHDEIRERRNQLQHPAYSKPELLAAAPNQLWSWDITKLRGPVTWTYYYLYVILDVFSRYAVGWMVAEEETSALAKQLIAQTCRKQNIEPGKLTLHADRGAPMVAKSVAQLLGDLGVVKTHSRPYTPNDNPYSEAQFKTLKYQPDYPDRFGSPLGARAWSRSFFNWYNNAHYHTALNLMTPATVHFGRAEAVRQQRNQVLQAAFAAHPERFVQGPPLIPSLPAAVWINKPSNPSDGACAP